MIVASESDIIFITIMRNQQELYHFGGEIMAEKQVRSRQRVTAYGEVLTGEREVKAMCDLVKQETERIESRFLEPACGNGNFLAEVLSRKLAVVKSRYDIMKK